MQDLIEYIALSLVDDPLQGRVSEYRRGPNGEIRLQVANEDMGRVIGKHGRVANSMRNLLKVAAAREGKRASLDIMEPK